MQAYIGVTIAILGGALAQLLMKSGLLSVSVNSLDAVVRNVQLQPIPSLMIFSGIAAYLASMMVWVHTLKHFELSKAFPLLSLGYVVVYLVSAIWPGLHETYSLQKSLGIALIIFGVWYSQEPPKKENA